MVRQSQRFLPICSLIISALGSTLTYPFIQDRTPPSGASPVRWNLAGAQPNISGGKIVYVINKLGSNDVNFATATSAVDAAFSTWRNANGSALDFLRTTDPSAASSGTTPITTDSINVVIWDENPSTPFKVPPLTYSSTVRLVDGTGYILDSDIILNASQFTWAARTDSNFTTHTGPLDIQSVVTHAIGLSLGLLLVPTDGAQMYTYDYAGDISLRSLSPDENAAALDIYPPVSPPAAASISGLVSRSGSPVFGAYVVAFINGAPQIGAIADSAGHYSIRRLAPATYTVRVVTLPQQIGSVYYSSLDNNFLSQSYSALSTDPATGVVVQAGLDTPGINFAVTQAGTADPWEPNDTLLTATPIIPDGRRQIHHSYPDGDLDWIQFITLANHIYQVDTSNLGSGSVLSDTTLSIYDPAHNLIDMVHYRDAKQATRGSRYIFRSPAGGTYFALVQQSFAGVLGSGTAYDISVQDLLTTLPLPGVTSVVPNAGPLAGGYQVTIAGSNFKPGASVLFGSLAATEVDVRSGGQLFATVPGASVAGPVSVTVTNIDGGGSVPLANAFTYNAPTYFDVADNTFAALGSFPGDTKASAWVDYNQDGLLDLYFTNNVNGQLYTNNGNGTFTNSSVTSFVSGLTGNVIESVAWGDYNQDGCPDIYAVSIVTGSNKLLKNNCNGTFTDVTSLAGVSGRANGRCRDASWADYDRDGDLDLFLADDDLAGPNQLFRNNGNGTFTDVAVAAGVNNTGSCLNANWGDFDRDGWPDLFVVRGGSQTDLLYHNLGNGTFADVTASAGIVDSAQGTDAVWGDFNGDGYLDLYVIGATGINHLFLNNTDQTFRDGSSPPTTQNAGNLFGSSQTVAAADLDLDGRLDLIIGQKADARTNSAWDYYLQNLGGSTPSFNPLSTQDSLAAQTMAFGDSSRIGVMDEFLGNAGAQTDFLLLNLNNVNNWLTVRLVGTISNKLGVGARVTAVALIDDLPASVPISQTREVLNGSKGQSAMEAHFGFGTAPVEKAEVNTLMVYWPASRITQTFQDIALNQTITIIEGSSSIQVTSVAPASGPTSGGTTTVVGGVNFDPNATVSIGGSVATITGPQTSTSITISTPGHAAGPAAVTVTNPSQPVGSPLRQGTLPNGFLYYGDAQESLFVFDRVNTTLEWGAPAGQVTFDVIRGNLSSMQVSGGQITLGAVLCLENDSTDTTTAPDHLDTAVPALGQGFFYLVRFGGSYGTSSSGLQDVPASGGCP